MSLCPNKGRLQVKKKPPEQGVNNAPEETPESVVVLTEILKKLENFDSTKVLITSLHIQKRLEDKCEDLERHARQNNKKDILNACKMRAKTRLIL